MSAVGRLFPPPLWNCFWLTLPILAFNAAFAGMLPPAFQPDIFWRDIPQALGLVENTFRTLALALTLLMPMDRRSRSGFGLYAVGVALYIGAWVPLLLAPDSAWSVGAAGFLAPALTPALWLAGIGMIGGSHSRGLTAAYSVNAGVFVVAHVTHALMVLAGLG